MKNFNTFVVVISLVGGLNGCKPLNKYDIIRMDRVNAVNTLLSDAKITISGSMVSSCEILVTSDGKNVIEIFSCGSNVLVGDKKITTESEPYGIIIKNLRKDPKKPGLLDTEDGCMAIVYENPERNILHGTTCELSDADPTTKKPKLTT